ncbi:vascular endothelial growth factor A-A-like isoform X1 [Periplaneta americana]|uniref:vascular endothelial growth factor A-A-like isoform X1 n=1 Tax=Periplaneta americana TaxID=6978 RepID=UPI0037E7BBA1
MDGKEFQHKYSNCTFVEHWQDKMFSWLILFGLLFTCVPADGMDCETRCLELKKEEHPFTEHPDCRCHCSLPLQYRARLVGTAFLSALNSSEDDSTENNTMAREEKCNSKEFNEIFNEHVSASRCKEPIDVAVELRRESPDVMYIPSTIKVKRCSGTCSKGITCQPKKKKMKVVSVHRYDKGKRSCGEVSIEEHEECYCDCEIMESHCGENKKYNRDSCACECINMEEKSDCEMKGDKYWNDDECKCQCRNTEECSIGFDWNDKECKCVSNEETNEV